MNETTEKRTTSAELKKQIDEATKAAKEQKIKTDLVQSGLPLSIVADRINANSTTEAPKAASKSEPAATTEPATEKEAVSEKESADLKEWAKKKGINYDTTDSTLLYLRSKDQEFHRKQAEKMRLAGERPQGAPVWTPPQTQFQPQPQNPYPSYVPPQRNVEELARYYNMTPEDFNRVAPLTRDMVNTFIQQERVRQAQELEDMKRENIKNSEFRELSADPVFRRPEVAKEFHDVLESMQESEPESFTQDPYAYRKAFDRALQNIGRRNLEGTSQEMNTATPFQLPKTPPKPVGMGSGGGREANENGLTPDQFNSLPSAEQRKYLESLGLVQPKY